MSHAKRLDKASTLFFLFGLIGSKLQTIPIPLAGLICNTIGLAFYLLGYILWTLASFLKPGQDRKGESWYGFVQFKKQYQLSGIIGAIGTILFFVALVTPVLFPIACWLIAVSNVIWFVAEYHKLKNPPTDDPTYSTKQQNLYVNYAIILSIGSVITAVGYTLAFAIPPAFIPIIIITTAIGLVFSLIAFTEWCRYFFGTFEPDIVRTSHHQMLNHFPIESPERNSALALELTIDDGYSISSSKGLHTEPTKQAEQGENDIYTVSTGSGMRTFN